MVRKIIRDKSFYHQATLKYIWSFKVTKTTQIFCEIYVCVEEFIGKLKSWNFRSQKIIQFDIYWKLFLESWNVWVNDRLNRDFPLAGKKIESKKTLQKSWNFTFCHDKNKFDKLKLNLQESRARVFLTISECSWENVIVGFEVRLKVSLCSSAALNSHIQRRFSFLERKLLHNFMNTTKARIFAWLYF